MSSKKTDGSFKVDPNGKRAEAAGHTESAPKASAPEKITEKKKMGRPNKGKSTGKRVNFVLSEEIYNKYLEVEAAFGYNFTQFAKQAIEKDLDNNFDIYKEIAKKISGK